MRELRPAPRVARSANAQRAAKPPDVSVSYLREPTAPEEHVVAVLDAERRLGRKLTLGERNVDIVGLDRDLAIGKARLHEAIEKEKRRALRSHFRRGATVKLNATPEMLAALRWLYEQGRRHGANEIENLTGERFKGGASEKDTIDRLLVKLTGHLRELQTKIEHKLGQMTGERLALSEEPVIPVREFAATLGGLGDVSQQAAEQQVMQIPGALNVASQMVSDATYSGVGSVYDEAAGLFQTWVYSAVMDDGTCDPCAEADGDEFDSWDAIQDVLPDGGPNPDCDGEGRCRCRAVPGEQAPVSQPAEEQLPPEPAGAPPPEFTNLPKHAQQPVEHLTVAEAQSQIKRLQGNIRGLHWHAKQGKPLNMDKLQAYERRIDELTKYIDSGAAPVRTAPEFGVEPGALKPGLDPRYTIHDAQMSAKDAKSFVHSGKPTRAAAKQSVQQKLGARLRTNSDFMESVSAPVDPAKSAFRADAKKLREFKPGDRIEMPAYPGSVYEVTGAVTKDASGLERVPVRIIKGPTGSGLEGQELSVVADRTAFPFNPVKPATKPRKVFKHLFPKIVTRSTDEAEQASAALVDKWAGTSADDNAWALAVQQATHDEFDLAEESLRHLQAKPRWMEAQEVYKEHGAALRAWVRAMWEQTQEELHAEGIDELFLYRGQGFLEDEYVSGVSANLSVRLQPASSFSADFGTASSFQRGVGVEAGVNIRGGGIIAARVPAERILGSARTGYGCLSEDEYVVLGKPVGSTDGVSAKMADYAGATVSDYEASFLTDISDAVENRARVTGERVTERDMTPDEFEVTMESINEFIPPSNVAEKFHVAAHLPEPDLEVLAEFVQKMSGSDMSKLLDKVAPNGVYVGHGGVTALDDLLYLKGAAQWDTSAGAYIDGKIVISSDLANSFGTSSANVYMHELGHAVGEYYGLDLGSGIMEQVVRLNDDGKLTPYLKNTRELWAEAFAIFNSSPSKGVGYDLLVNKFDKQFADWFDETRKASGWDLGL